MLSRLPDTLAQEESARIPFASFARAAAEIMLETDTQGTIRQAIGAFEPLFGEPALNFVGRPVRTLIGDEDRTALVALVTACVCGESCEPLLLRIDDEARTPLSVAATLTPERQGVLVTLSRPPRLAHSIGPGEGHDVAPPPAESGLTESQATGALRFALDRYASLGKQTTLADFRSRLSEVIATAERHANAMSSAINRRGFEIVFQPVVRLSTREVHHYEALLRPTRDPALPPWNTHEFVTFAEAVGLFEALDWAVIEEVVGALDSRASHPVAVNISGLSLQSGTFSARIIGLFAGRPALSDRLLIELTETADIHNIEAAKATIEALRAAGVRVCIDDFGAGFAAFRYLHNFAVDYVKIDGAYVQRAGGGARESGFVGSMVELANVVGAKAIAEMIETEEQAVIMASLGVEFGQGWLFGKPGPLPRH